MLTLSLPTLDFLRSPSITPSLDTSCPNPASMTTIVCALWKNKLYPWDGINTGEIRGKNFTVVIAGMSLTTSLPPFLVPLMHMADAIQAPTCTRGTTLTPCRAVAIARAAASGERSEAMRSLEGGAAVRGVNYTGGVSSMPAVIL